MKTSFAKVVLRKDPIIIIGMHRSGTTMLTRYLTDNGVFMGCDLDNNTESTPLIAINDRWLSKEGASWFEPVTIHGQYELDSRFLKHFFCYKKVGKLSELIKSNAWGWKDPRNTFTLDKWLSLFPNAKVINIYRNGIDVAFSLYKRNEKLKGGFKNKIPEFTLLKAFKLWESYIKESFKYRQGQHYFELKYEELGVNPNKAGLEKFLGIPLNYPISDVFVTKREKVKKFYELEAELLNHAKSSKIYFSLYGDQF